MATQWTSGLTALWHQLEALRGFVELDLDSDRFDGVVYYVKRWPRSTGHDVITLAAVLDQALRHAPRTYGDAPVLERWRACMVDLERDGWTQPERTFSGNRTFWSLAHTIAVLFDASGYPPPSASTWDGLRAMFTQSRHSVRNGDDDDEGNAEETLVRQRQSYLAKRGVDERYPKLPPPLPQIPRTTNADASFLASYWRTRIARVLHALPEKRTEALQAKLDALSKQWSTAATAIEAAVKGAPADAPYRANDALWASVRDLALGIDPLIIAALTSGLSGSITGVLHDAASEAGQLLSGAASGAGQLLSGAAHAVGDIAGAAAKGFLGEFTTPLLVVGGGVAAVWLLSRDKKEAHA